MSHLVTHGRQHPGYPDDYQGCPEEDHYLDDYGDYGDYADYDDYPPPADHRWRPVAVVAGGVFLAAVIGAAIIVNSDSTGSQTITVGPPPTRVVAAPPGPATSTAPAAPPPTSLSPETVTTLPPSVTPSGQPTAVPSATAAPEAAAPAPAPVNPRAVVYTVSGTKQLFDLVNVIYTDAQGHPHTDVNVSLPWHKTVVLNPGVQLKSVVATSLSGQLSCAITDAQGQVIVASTNNTLIATCTR